MKKLIALLVTFAFFASATVFAAPESDAGSMDVGTLTQRLVKELSLVPEGQDTTSYQDVVVLLPENIQAQLNSAGKESSVTRVLLAEILSNFLDPDEISDFFLAGDEDDVLSSDEINSLFSKCNYDESGILTYIKPPQYSFKENMDVRNPDIPQVEGGDSVPGQDSISGGA